MKHKQLLTALFISLSTLLATLSDAQALRWITASIQN